MYIPFIYILFIAEAMLIFLVLSIVLGITTYRLASRKATPLVTTSDNHPINLGSSYIEHLDTEIMKNLNQEAIDNRSEHDNQPQHTQDDTTHEKHSKLLKMRDLFLKVERHAAEHADNDINFWQQIYDGMDNVYDHFKTIEHKIEIIRDENVVHKKEMEEKVFYVEIQGRKIDGEVNRLKDIIFDQENTLSDMIKALKKVEDEHPLTKDSEIMAELHVQISNFERQLRDSKTCMEVLEMENNRLQEEARKHMTTQADAGEPSATVDIQSMRKMIEKQEQQINELSETIDGLKLSAEQTEKIRNTLDSFVHSSQEMMTCITILEEENERLLTISGDGSAISANEQTLKTQIKKLEEELIKKDVVFAKLQDEFASMEKEYLAMYNAIHGDK